MDDLFDESRLDDERALAAHDHVLRPLAEAGARVRRDHVEALESVVAAVLEQAGARPRAVVAAGPDSRLLRAVLEPWCPVPFVAWPHAGLPGWVGGLDLVVVLAPHGDDEVAALAVAEGERRGAQVVVAAPEGSLVAQHAAGRWSRLLPVVTGDQLAAAVVVLDLLDRLDLGPGCDPEEVAGALDTVALACSPHRDLAVNPAKGLAIALADSRPVVWGGSVLAARAARRVAEALRHATGHSAIAGETHQLLPVLESAPQRDLFDDPWDDPDAPSLLIPSLLLLDDGADDERAAAERAQLVRAAHSRRIRVETITCEQGRAGGVARYSSLLSQGRYAAAYLNLGSTEPGKTGI
ncbi:SIS domain-containing protein [Nocardioides yefusunii]|uniref:SIS domain-containing protein n=1 Tax=Nocardioides yefusunii TaxID=2500546 RepID=A0ABW1R1H2_9ACTN|nr:SIS domain-containing protein [Nocardioides yefusunii]